MHMALWECEYIALMLLLQNLDAEYNTIHTVVPLQLF